MLFPVPGVSLRGARAGVTIPAGSLTVCLRRSALFGPPGLRETATHCTESRTTVIQSGDRPGQFVSSGQYGGI